jgi:hypothetical protein
MSAAPAKSSCSRISIPCQEMTMSMLQATDVYQSQAKKTDHKNGFGFITLLVCIVLGVAVAAAIFPPAAIGSGISNDTVYVGP